MGGSESNLETIKPGMLLIIFMDSWVPDSLLNAELQPIRVPLKMAWTEIRDREQEIVRDVSGPSRPGIYGRSATGRIRHGEHDKKGLKTLARDDEYDIRR